MINWIKKNMARFIGICLLVFAIATATPTLASYGLFQILFNTDLRPLLLAIDTLAFTAGVTLTVIGGIE